MFFFFFFFFFGTERGRLYHKKFASIAYLLEFLDILILKILRRHFDHNCMFFDAQPCKPETVKNKAALTAKFIVLTNLRLVQFRRRTKLSNKLFNTTSG